MRYRIRHRTAYSYAEAVHESFNEVRLRPLSGETQNCLDFDLAIDPPATVITFRDFYGNIVHDFGVPYLHDHLTIEATSDVMTFALADQPLAGPPDGTPDHSPAIAAVATDPVLADEHAEFLIPSTYVAMESTSREIARALLAGEPAISAYGFLLEAGAYIRGHFAYQVGVTTVHSTVSDLIAGGSGVCQDFAHLLISLCRHAGLPARYVSGYLGDVSVSGASHAWAEAFVPPYGWLGFDATLGRPCTGRHVKIAVGRDYADVSVVRGTYRGQAEATLAVEVQGTIIDDGWGLAAARPVVEHARGEPVQYQTLGAMKQLQRLGAMTQSLGSMSQTMTLLPTGMPGRVEASDVPRQQPQQQQQRRPTMIQAGGDDLHSPNETVRAPCCSG